MSLMTHVNGRLVYERNHCLNRLIRQGRPKMIHKAIEKD